MEIVNYRFHECNGCQPWQRAIKKSKEVLKGFSNIHHLRYDFSCTNIDDDWSPKVEICTTINFKIGKNGKGGCFTATETPCPGRQAQIKRWKADIKKLMETNPTD